MTADYPISDKCLREAPAPCMHSCVYHLDLRTLMKRAQSGRMNYAYRGLVAELAFPEIAVAICGQTCRGSCPHHLAINQVERACIAACTDKRPPSFRLPRRNKKIAVVGGGICGMSCAVKLAAKMYDVTVFEASPRLGGSLEQVLPAEIYLAEFERQFGNVSYELRLNCRPILGQLTADYDAALIASGAGGEDFGLLASWDAQSLATGLPGVFLGGRLTGADLAHSLVHGLRAAYAIECFTKVGTYEPPPDTPHQHKRQPTRAFTDERPVVAAGDSYTSQEAAQEAGRCDLCQCSLCMDICPLLQQFGYTPQLVERDGMMAERPAKGLGERIGTRLIASCAMCGKCREVCPERVDLGAFLLDKRNKLFAEGVLTPAWHDFFIRELRDSAEQWFYAGRDKSYPRASYLFFPGCQMAASDPMQVEVIYNYLRQREPSAGLLLTCCGVPAEWAGDRRLRTETAERIRRVWQDFGRPVLVAACPTCCRVLGRQLPEIPLLSLYEWLEQQDTAAPPGADGEWELFDPCASRDFPAMQRAVRRLAERSGLRLHAAEPGRADCCGMGGHVFAANPQISCDLLRQAATRSDLPYVTYCSNCRDLLLRAGKQCIHVVDLLFGLTPAAAAPHVDEMRRNRRRLTQRLRGEPEPAEPPQRELRLDFSAALRDKLDALLISADEAEQVVRQAEASATYALRPGDGQRIAHDRIGAVTCWVIYSAGEDRFTVNNVYCHRMNPLEGVMPQKNAKAVSSGIAPSVPARPEAMDGEAYHCVSCDQQFQPADITFAYLGQELHHVAPRCPRCGRVVLSEDLVRGKMHQVETVMEDK